MVKTNAERQSEYHEEDKYLEKERKQPKKYYQKVAILSKNELKARCEAIEEEFKNTKTLLKRSLIVYRANSTASLESLNTPVVNMKFPKRGDYSWKRRCHGNDRIFKNKAKLEEGIDYLKKRNT